MAVSRLYICPAGGRTCEQGECHMKRGFLLFSFSFPDAYTTNYLARYAHDACTGINLHVLRPTLLSDFK